MRKQSLGNRMKHNYEEAFKFRLPARIPVIIRLDGKCFHSFTKKMEKPFDEELISVMQQAAKVLCEEVEGCQLAYVQSDEISLLLHNYKRLDSQAWFDNEIQKMVSISASIASTHVSLWYDKVALFDSRVFVLPEAEVNNYFIWRQQDWERNSLLMLAQSLYSHKELQNKKKDELMELCFSKGKNWNDLDNCLKRGSVIIKGEFGWEIGKTPIFNQNHKYINRLLVQEEE